MRGKRARIYLLIDEMTVYGRLNYSGTERGLKTNGDQCLACIVDLDLDFGRSGLDGWMFIRLYVLQTGGRDLKGVLVPR